MQALDYCRQLVLQPNTDLVNVMIRPFRYIALFCLEIGAYSRTASVLHYVAETLEHNYVLWQKHEMLYQHLLIDRIFNSIITYQVINRITWLVIYKVINFFIVGMYISRRLTYFFFNNYFLWIFKWKCNSIENPQ